MYSNITPIKTYGRRPQQVVSLKFQPLNSEVKARGTNWTGVWKGPQSQCGRGYEKSLTATNPGRPAHSQWLTWNSLRTSFTALIYESIGDGIDNEDRTHYMNLKYSFSYGKMQIDGL
jgi:hypothetical protein